MDESWGGFRARMLEQGRLHWRDLPWRHTQDPYAIWISEVMLQQTQVSRVDGRWQRWLAAFPTIEALAVAQPADVLQEWQGLGRSILMATTRPLETSVALYTLAMPPMPTSSSTR